MYNLFILISIAIHANVVIVAFSAVVIHFPVPVAAVILNHIHSLITKRLIHRQPTQNLSIQHHPTLRLRIDKIRVQNIMLSHPSIQPLDPQFAKFMPGFFEAADGYVVAVFGSSTEAF
jgi:hypothetical protein